MKDIEISKEIQTMIEKEELNEVNYLNSNNLEKYKQKNFSEKCSKCNRPPKYLNNETNELFCWIHSTE